MMGEVSCGGTISGGLMGDGPRWLHGDEEW